MNLLKIFTKQESQDNALGKNTKIPLKRFAQQHLQLHMAYLVSMLVAVVCIVYTFRSIAGLRYEERIFVVDGANTVYAGPLEELIRCKEYIGTVSLLANQVIFDRNPDGLGMPEVAATLLHPEALQMLNEDVRESSEEFESKCIHQKSKVLSITHTLHAGMPLVQIEGEAIASGHLGEVALVQGRKYTLFLRFVKNTNLSQVSAYPLIVREFRIDLHEEE